MQQQPQHPRWVESNANAFRHASSVLVVVNDYIIAVGGEPRKIRIFEPSGNIGSQPRPHEINFTPDSVDLKIVQFSACAYKQNKIVIFGGQHQDPPYNINSDVFIITIQERDGGREIFANCKIQTTTDNNCRRVGHSAHIFNNAMYVIGGTTGHEDNANLVWRLELDPYYQWEHKNVTARNPLPMPRWDDGHKSVLMGSKIYVHNKHKSDALQYVNDQIYMLDLQANLANLAWVRVNVPALNYRIEPLYFDEMKGIDDKLFFFERDPPYDPRLTYPEVIHCYNTTSGTWEGRIKLPDLANPTPRPFSLITYKNRLVLWRLDQTIYQLDAVPNLPFVAERSEEEYRRLIHDIEAQNVQLQGQNTNLDRDLQARNQRIAQLGDAGKRLTDELQGRMDGETLLANEVNGLQQRLNNNQQMTRNIQNGQRRVQLTPDLEQEIRRSERRKNDIVREHQRTEDAKRALERENGRLNERLKGSRQESKVSEDHRANISEQIHRENQRLSELEEKKDLIQDRINEQVSLSNRLERERAKLESQLIERQNDIAMLKTDNTRLKGNYSYILIALISFCLLLLNYLWKP